LRPNHTAQACTAQPSAARMSSITPSDRVGCA
jgi:hypothetical protein